VPMFVFMTAALSMEHHTDHSLFCSCLFSAMDCDQQHRVERIYVVFLCVEFACGLRFTSRGSRGHR
jgi:hypothetical protein